jgi:hypothetical protein
MPVLISIEQQLKDAAKIITNPPLIIPAQKSVSSLFFNLESFFKHQGDLKTIFKEVFLEPYTYSQHYRLGVYYEYLIGQILKATDISILKAQAPLYEGKKTLGEIDYLIDLPNQGSTHLEVAYKIYALTENGWLGPNPTDSLSDKVKHLFANQLRLYHRYTNQWVNSNLDIPINFKALIQGLLFLPANTSLPQLSFPINVEQHEFEINVESCIAGVWLHRNEFEKFAKSHDFNEWQVLEKPEWILKDSSNKVVHYSEIDALIPQHLSAILKASNKDDLPNTQRQKQQDKLVLLLPNEWPRPR